MKRTVLTLALLLFALGCGGKSPAPGVPKVEPEPVMSIAPGEAFYRDVTAASGVNFRYRNGEEADLYTILESLGGGVALFDADGDGRLDLFATGGGTFDSQAKIGVVGLPNAFYRNDTPPGGAIHFRDATKEVGLGGIIGYGQGVSVADFDRDGRPDLFVTAYGRVALYRNTKGEGGTPRFVDVTATAKLPASENADFWPTCSAWGDFDLDGYPDLFIGQYVNWTMANNPECPGQPGGPKRDVCPPQKFAARPPLVFRNRGDGTFEEVTSKLKLRTDGKALGCLVADFNGDGRPDIYIANDASDNFLYINRSNWNWEEIGPKSGTAKDERGVYNGSMGVDVADYDRAGRPSLFVTNFENEWHALYRNRGGERFSYDTTASGLAAIGQKFVGFGTAFVDVDRDGWEDLVLLHGHVLRHPVNATLSQLPKLLLNEPIASRRRFRDASSRGGDYFATPHRGRGLAVGDLDGDGIADLVCGNVNEPIAILKGQIPEGSPSAKAKWVAFDLISPDRRSLAGGSVTVEAGSASWRRYLKSGGSYFSHGDDGVLIPLGNVDESKVKLTVHLPGGKTQTFNELAVNRKHRIELKKEE